MDFLFLLILLFSPAFILARLTLSVPVKYLGLYTSWITLFIILSYVEILKIPQEENYGILSRVLIINAVIIYFFVIINITKEQERKETNSIYSSLLTKILDIQVKLRYLTFSVYGFTASYLLNLFYGDILAGLQSAWIAYLLAIIGIIIVAYIPEFIPLEEFENKKTIKRCFQFSAYSL